MHEAIKAFFSRARPRPETAPPPAANDPGAELRVAACALLLELAHADQEFSADERRHVEQALGTHFDLPSEDVQELMTLAEAARREATDLYRFTSVINEHYDEGQKMLLAEVVWRVVLADGKLSEHEDALMRKLARLLELRPGYLAEARRRVAPPQS
jgi:uncharacterized tellurite resistance protein B-like protein